MSSGVAERWPRHQLLPEQPLAFLTGMRRIDARLQAADDQPVPSTVGSTACPARL